MGFKLGGLEIFRKSTKICYNLLHNVDTVPIIKKLTFSLKRTIEGTYDPCTRASRRNGRPFSQECN